MRSDEQSPLRQPRGELESWWSEHGELDRLFGGLFSIIASGRAAAASDAFEDLAEALEAHLSVEEDVYFPLIERLSPAHGSVVREARLAHLGLRDRMGALRTHLADGQLEPAKSLLARLLEELRDHERAEARLIADLGT